MTKQLYLPGFELSSGEEEELAERKGVQHLFKQEPVTFERTMMFGADYELLRRVEESGLEMLDEAPVQ